jgi:DNA (cytosine-5)-methyltransferase 1
MKFLDLFAGVGGIRLGMEQAGHSCVGWVEWDKFARKSYMAIHKPDGEFTEEDINNVNSQELPKADCWCFGFPCQDISVAGKQGGFTNGKRSSLFFTVTGLIKQLKEEDKPSYLFIENVKNLLSINKGWDFAKLLIEMDEIGYDVEWDVLDSAEVVPQHRERIFIVGHLRGRCTRKVFPIIRKSGQTTESNAIKVIGNTSNTGYKSKDVLDPTGLSTTLLSRDYKGPKKIAVKQLGNISNSKSFGGNQQTGRVYGTDGIAPTLSTMQGGGQEPKIAIPVLAPDRIKKRQNGRRFKTNGEPEFTLTGQDRHGQLEQSKVEDLRIRKLTPLECWRLQGFPDWAFNLAREAGLSDSQLYKQAGNSVTVPVIKAIADRMGYKEKQ